ncbi:MAG: isocitrate lyase/phosphoenolpyruvate mutase family protein [Candidatus Bathyarchaeota archaeon]|nr:isocitrate lyase/phosphoenolpyruvate mutase family protein [Candidatus Bathyarchaeota archaeon]
MSKAAKLRKLFQEKDLVRIVGAHDGLTAKLVEKHGFEGIWASGLEISASHAVPDANILTMTDYLEAAIEMNEAVSIPIVADCDTGYGGLNNIIRTVEKYESNGIAAICLEDKRFPKINSLLQDVKHEILPIPEFVARIVAAKKTQKTKDFMVFARVEALIAGLGLQEALKRAKAYTGAGADGIFIHSKSRSPQPIVDFVNSWDGDVPLVICPTTYPSLTEEEIRRLTKVKMVIYANQGLRAAIKAVNSTLSEISRNGIAGIDEKIAPLKAVFELQGMAEMLSNEEEVRRLVGNIGER